MRAAYTARCSAIKQAAAAARPPGSPAARYCTLIFACACVASKISFAGHGAQLTLADGGWTNLAPSAIPQKSGERPPAALDAAGIRETVEAFAQAARRAGLRVPEDLTVVGFDDFQIAQAVWPPLTTIHIPTREVGRMAAEKLIGRETREARDPASTIPYLVSRESSAPPPKS